MDIVHAHLEHGLPELPGNDGRRDVLLVAWWRARPLGHVELNGHGMPPRALAEAIAHAIVRPVGERLLGAPFAGFNRSARIPPPPEGAPLEALRALRRPLDAMTAQDAPPLPPRVTVAICTRRRPDDIDRCLRSVLAADCEGTEVLVVDNEPSPETRAVVERHPAVRYVVEARPGLSAARNAAIAAATGDIVAFVDDDTDVHPAWLRWLCADFADPEVMAVTGLVLPAALDTPARVAFQKHFGGLNHGYQPMAFGPDWMARTRRRGTPVWKIGAGANMAVRRDALELVGPFDERLGAGAWGCSEDSELWYRLLAEGWQCRYLPASVVFHHHRADPTALRAQARQYMRGHVAALFVQFGRYRHPGNLVRALVVMPPHQASSAARATVRWCLLTLGVMHGRPARPALPELVGYLRGLALAPAAIREQPPRHKASLRSFLRSNPYPHPLTEGFFYREKMRAIHRVAPDRPTADVLEVGGGRSGLARSLYPAARITNVDLDPAYGEAHVNQDARVRFVAADATALPFEDESFDAVTFFDVLEHIPDDRAAVAEAWRVLRPGGWILMSSPNLRWRSPYHRVMAPICPSSEDMMARWGHVRRGYDERGLRALFGTRPASTADFINPVTVVCHDLSFSRVGGRLRRALCWMLAPVTWTAYALQPKPGQGTETAASWRKPVR